MARFRLTRSAEADLARILAVSAGEHLTGQIMGTVMSYTLVPDGATTRLLLKLVTRKRHVYTPLLSLGDLIMARRQLLNIARLSEQNPPS